MTCRDQVDADTLRVLVATDTHLGFMEKDEIRGNDSFDAFNEICSIAIEQQVDFMLLGGDLFHENKPSRSTLVKTIEILRRYCLSDRPVQFEVVSDQSVNFGNKFGHVNYKDPNFKIGLPVFVIHGNHDDPAGVDNLSSLDILSASNLLNYFGKVGLAGSGVGQITLHPILMHKGSTRVALYGLGNIRDERLNRMFQMPHAVEWIRPDNQEDCSASDWFNMFVLHQNRVKSNPKNAVNETFLAGFLDFVIWGHEHECLVEPQEVAGMGFHITQPGSSIATALTDGESKPKHVLMLEIKGNQYRPTKIPLQSVRPFEFTEVSLKDDPDLDANDPAKIAEFLGKVVQESITRATAKVVKKELMIPLVRIKVDYSGFTTINPQRFGQKFVGKVANPHDLLIFTKQAKKRLGADEKEEKQMLPPEELNQQNIEALLAESNLKMEILPLNDLAIALHDFVNKDDKQAFITCVQQTLEETRNKLVEEEEARDLLEEKDLAAKISEHMLRREAERENRARAGLTSGHGASALGPQRAAIGGRASRTGSQAAGDDDDEEFAAEPRPIASSRGRRQSETAARRPAAGAAGAPTGRGRGRALKQTTLDLIPRARPSQRAASAAATATLQGLSDDETENTCRSDEEDVLKNVEEVEDSDMEVDGSSKGKKRQVSGRGRGRGRGSTASTPAKRGRKSTRPAGRTTCYIDDDNDDDDDLAPAGRDGSAKRTPSKTPARRNYGSLRK